MACDEGCCKPVAAVRTRVDQVQHEQHARQHGGIERRQPLLPLRLGHAAQRDACQNLAAKQLQHAHEYHSEQQAERVACCGANGGTALREQAPHALLQAQRPQLIECTIELRVVRRRRMQAARHSGARQVVRTVARLQLTAAAHLRRVRAPGSLRELHKAARRQGRRGDARHQRVAYKHA
jgi:hypothetical protein